MACRIFYFLLVQKYIFPIEFFHIQILSFLLFKLFFVFASFFRRTIFILFWHILLIHLISPILFIVITFEFFVFFFPHILFGNLGSIFLFVFLILIVFFLWIDFLILIFHLVLSFLFILMILALFGLFLFIYLIFRLFNIHFMVIIVPIDCCL